MPIDPMFPRGRETPRLKVSKHAAGRVGKKRPKRRNR